MEAPLAERLRAAFIIFILMLATASSDRDLNFCGTWHHGKHALSLRFNVNPGCAGISVSADERSLSINGDMAAHCRRSGVHHLTRDVPDAEASHFCLHWEPLQDQLKLQVGGKNFTLCWPTGMPEFCCTYLSHGANAPEAAYGVSHGTIGDDVITRKTLTDYSFAGSSVQCATFCPAGSRGSAPVNLTDPAAMGSDGKAPCAALSSEVEMNDDFGGADISLPLAEGEPPELATSIHLPAALKRAAKANSKVVYTFFRNNVLFQDGLEEVRILDDVVEISVGNEVIEDLPEPIRIGFRHDVVPKTHSRTCVSWDTRKDPMKVKWSEAGCATQQRGERETECLCDHLTYFTVLVQVKPGPVRHLLALSAITSLGCAVSFVSCIALIVFLCRRRRGKDPSAPIHLGLAVSLAFLNLLFFFTGVLANVGGHGVCVLAAAGLHYALLSSFSWMGIEVFHTFWLVYVVFRPLPSICLWNLLGFVLPAVPVVVLAAVGDVYGVREVVSSEDEDHPFRMCWMKKNYEALLAHYLTNLIFLVILVSAGLVMLLLVYREIRPRDEWQKNRVAFFSIWGLSCLYGTTWGLTFLDFGPFSEFILFLSCILNSFQGFLLMLRFCVLDWMRKHQVRMKESPAKVRHVPASPSTLSQEPLEPLCSSS